MLLGIVRKVGAAGVVRVVVELDCIVGWRARYHSVLFTAGKAIKFIACSSYCWVALLTG